MADHWMPGVERKPQGNGGTMVGGPPRALWHITYDALGAGGRQPAFDAVMNYLRDADYCPHLMWDPWTGRIVQFYPANQSAKALAHPAGTGETNRMGSACIQIEIFFSPRAVRGGKKYMTVADTPCKGLPEIVAWLRSWAIPDVWPSGWPEWSGNSRSLKHWKGKGGHYGHSQVPVNTHTDPGPMPKTMFEEDDVALSDDDIKKIWNTDGIVTSPTGNPENPQWTPASHLTDIGKQTRAILAALGRTGDADDEPTLQSVLTGLAPATIATAVAAALPADLARQVLDELAARLAG